MAPQTVTNPATYGVAAQRRNRRKKQKSFERRPNVRQRSATNLDRRYKEQAQDQDEDENASGFEQVDHADGSYRGGHKAV